MGFIGQNQEPPTGKPPQKSPHTLCPIGQYLFYLRGNPGILAATGIACKLFPIVKMSQRHHRLLFHVFTIDCFIVRIIHETENVSTFRFRGKRSKPPFADGYIRTFGCYHLLNCMGIEKLHHVLSPAIAYPAGAF